MPPLVGGFLACLLMIGVAALFMFNNKCFEQRVRILFYACSCAHFTNIHSLVT